MTEPGTQSALEPHPERPLLRYRGSKWRLAPWIIEHLPPHRIYVEAFGGGAGVLLRKPRATTEVYNDLDSSVVALFRVLRDVESSAKLARLLELTPFAREEYVEAYEPIDNDPVESARRLLSRSYMGQGSKSIWSRSGFDARVNEDGFASRLASLYHLPETVIACAERLRGVIVEHGDAVDLIGRFDRSDAVIYLDPPYLPETSTRPSAQTYRHEMSSAGHRRLLEAAGKLSRAMVVVSGYPSELYDHYLAGWRKAERPAHTDHGRGATEAIWINPAAVQAMGQSGAAAPPSHSNAMQSVELP